jgi:hypothetical protein
MSDKPERTFRDYVKTRLTADEIAEIDRVSDAEYAALVERDETIQK